MVTAEHKQREGILSERESSEAKPPSPLAEEYEAISLLGLIAAGLCGTMLVSSWYLTTNADLAGIELLAAGAVAYLMLVGVIVFNDQLLYRKSIRIMGVVSVLLLVGGVVASPIHWSFGLISVAGFVLLLAVWTNYPCSRSHADLLRISVVVFGVCGIAFAVSVLINAVLLIDGAACLFAVVSVALALTAQMRFNTDTRQAYSLHETKERRGALKSNFSKNFAEGIVLCSSVTLIASCEMSWPSGIVLMLYGGLVAVTAVVTFLLRQLPDLKYERFMNWFMVPFCVSVFLLLPWVSGIARVVLAMVLAVLSSSYVMTFVTAYSEFSRGEKLSAFYSFGREGSQFALGFAVSALAIIIVGILSEQGGIVAPVVVECGLAIAALVFLNVDIVRGGFPVPTGAENAALKTITSRYGTSLAVRVNLAANEYGLTERQREVLGMLAHRHDVEYISEQLGISPATAKSHMYTIFKKLGVQNAQQLVELIEGMGGEETSKDGFVL